MLIALLAGCDAGPTPHVPPPDRGAAGGTTSPAPPETSPPDTRGDALFAGDRVHRVAITLHPGSRDALLVDPEAWVPADLVVDGVRAEGVGVRLKGGGSFRPLDDKPSFKISLDEFVDDLAVDGLDELVLNNMIQDPSMLRERLAYTALRGLGLPAPRCAHAVVEVDGAPYGLYALVEAQDGRFLDRWYADDDGPLFEMFDVDFRTEDVPRFDHDGGPDERGALLGLAEALADGGPLAGAPSAFLDVDGFLAYFAAAAAIGQYDAYPYSWPGDDVLVYVDPTDGRIDLLAHGGDETFADRERPADYVFGLLGARCLEDVDCTFSWRERVWDTLDGLDALDLPGEVDTIAAQIDAEIDADPRQPNDRAVVADEQDAVRAFLVGRAHDLAALPGWGDP